MFFKDSQESHRVSAMFHILPSVPLAQITYYSRIMKTQTVPLSDAEDSIGSVANTALSSRLSGTWVFRDIVQ